MEFIDTTVDMTAALGTGIYSVGQNIVRTGEGLGLGSDGRMAIIGYENRAMASLVEEFVKYGINDQRGPLCKSIVHVLEHYYSYFPDQAVYVLAKQAGIGAGYTI